MEWKENFSMEYGIVKVWNGTEDISSMEWKNFFILFHFNAVFILQAVNKAAFDQTKNDEKK